MLDRADLRGPTPLAAQIQHFDKRGTVAAARTPAADHLTSPSTAAGSYQAAADRSPSDELARLRKRVDQQQHRSPDRLLATPVSADDPASAVEIGRRWADALSRRDADALVEITDPGIAFYPTQILRNRDVYSGHDGLRQWIADIAAAHTPITERITDVRPGHAGHVVALGHVVLRDKPTSPFSLLMSLRADKVAEARAYLSDEAQLKRIGRLPA
ncbi:MAG TPA: nuclear transport factor 2 family protein [Solirubrobacteraceae bacterium]|nr:nuclear transport factor 2 family protein [Solirubrobacteraceae bacterium]